ncbi:PTS lactose/cellobiose transporter subunit IIA [Vagococcus entomophilus]|uniref:PTS lactose/cellobiose transporter subunit IIA n=1 Tax=Vagococcus entomophilus TaxID=1160095 RepID=A0A430AF06_9ENTE|nr:PTS lactose/cellobiose transporter subunit IIA [Vagococcus entomophilus]RSU06163.1 PTS lactose/cellobiose transporter subunit IIA [Vagococcus entomophilus]
MTAVDREALNVLSMQVILHAGNARERVFQALTQASKGNFEAAKQFLHEANQEIVSAHNVQTSTLQKEAEGVMIPYSALFGHAQDTLMTVMSELNMVKEMIKLYQKIGGG